MTTWDCEVEGHVEVKDSPYCKECFENLWDDEFWQWEQED